MKLLIIAPVPPPLMGQSLVDKVLIDELSKKHSINVVNLSKSSFKSGIDSFRRIYEILMIFREIWLKKKNVEVIYFTISESLAGNIKDMIIYLLCFKQLSKMIIHLHGGSMREGLFNKSRLLFVANKYFISRLKNVIISGRSHENIFEGMIKESKIKIIPNFSEDYLFINEDEIKSKFEKTLPLKILYLSNLIEGKGYIYLVDAFLSLDEELKKNVFISFAGGSDPDSLKKSRFIEKIKGVDHIEYHGFVDNNMKKKLLVQSHILCFPSFLLEGQGLVILEAYATGCVVITTGQGGIKDVFEDKINGFQIEQKSSLSIKSVIEEVLKKPDNLLSIAISNNRFAHENYRSHQFTRSIIALIENNAEHQS